MSSRRKDETRGGSEETSKEHPRQKGEPEKYLFREESMIQMDS